MLLSKHSLLTRRSNFHLNLWVAYPPNFLSNRIDDKLEPQQWNLWEHISLPAFFVVVAAASKYNQYGFGSSCDSICHYLICGILMLSTNHYCTAVLPCQHIRWQLHICFYNFPG